MNIKYILKKLLIPIVLLILSAAAVIGRFESWFCYGFLKSYLIFALFVIGVGIVIHFAGEAFPRKFVFSKGFFSCAPWEKGGRVYDDVFRVSAWKDLLIDASKMFSGTKSKSLSGKTGKEEIYSAVQEMCAGELCHWILVVLSFALLFLISRPWKWLFWAIYLIANLADIVIQRYNRPRLVKIYDRLLNREEKS